MTTKQQPIGSGFGAATTAEEITGGANLTGTVAVVTGGYSGIGLETTRVLSAVGATVIVPARTPEKARAALQAIPGVELEQLDLLDPASVDSFAERFLATGRPLHLLINNAGIMAVPLTRDARGFESQFAANHLGHFQLTLRLWPGLRRANNARVVTLSSGAHRYSEFNFDDSNFERREYDKWKAYGQSKTANILFTLELDRRASKHGVRAFAVHPGRIATDLQRSIPLEELQKLGFRDEHGHIPEDQLRLYKTVEQGAATSVWCATSPALNGMGGVYCENIDIAQAVPADHKEMNGVMPWAIDSDAAKQLWILSESLTGTGVDKLPSPVADEERLSW